MRLDRLHIQNFRCYEDATFNFQPGFNLVVGVNGSGKTSLLQAVAGSFVEFGNAMKSGQPYSIDENVRVVIDKHQGRTRFEKKFPLSLTANGDVLGATEWMIIGLVEDWPAASSKHLKNTIDQFLAPVEAKKCADLPILAFYRADRRWKNANISAEFAAQQKTSRFDSYSNCFDAVVDLKDFESWLIARTLERMQTLLDEGLTSSEFDDELEWVNQAIQFALPQAKDLRYDLRMQSLLVDMGDEQVFPFSQLSDGQRGMVALFADIARRMCILNPHMGKDVLKNTSGIVIIDELDIHLHPAWQRKIVPALKNAFPKVQFIAASHSPQIIGGLRPGEIMLLHDGNATHPRVSYGLDSSTVLEEIFGVSEREPRVEALLNELFSTIEDNDLEKAKLRLQKLKEIAPDLPEFAGAEALIRRKEILGK